MALVKVSLMSELAMLRLLKVGRRADNHYQQATQDYCAQLRDLYRASVRERRRQVAAARRSRKQASALSSETFKLTLSLEAGKSLPGISLARTSLPLAEQGDQVQLLRVPAGSTSGGVDESELLTRGVILLVNEQQVRIKFHEPLKAKPTAKSEAPKENQVNGTHKGPEESKSIETTEEKKSDEIEKAPEEVIYFRVKFDLNSAKPLAGGVGAELDKEKGEHEQLIEEVLHNFAKLKCNHALHRNLMGQYDERKTEVNISDRTRILPNATLGRLRPNGQQRAAIEQALKRRLTLIEGPAGSGKTFVAALIAANACRLRDKSRVLVCSPLQPTVDKLTELLMQLLGGHQQVIKLPENATAGTRNPRLARRAPSTGKQRRQRSMPSVNVARGKRDSFVSQLTQPDLSLYDQSDEDDDDDDEQDERQQQRESNRAHLDKIVDDEIYLQAYARSKDTLGHNHEQLHAHAYRMVTSCSPLKRREMEAKMISKANVVCCTLVQAASYLLTSAEFDLLILDDVQLTSELDCLVAIMTRGIKQVTLLSDTRRRIRLARSRHLLTSSNQQVPPGSASDTTDSRGQITKPNGRSTPRSARTPESSGSDASDSETSQDGARAATTNGGGAKSRGAPAGVSLEPGNLFERLLSLGLPTVDMRVQYRCHATLSNFFNHHFYAGRLKDDRKTNEKLAAEINTSLLVREQNFAWMPNRKYLTGLFWAKNAQSDLEASMRHVLTKLLKDENIQESRIGVIYNKHSLLARAKRNASSSHRLSDLKQATIDGFIGQERDFIILVAGAGSGGSLAGEDEKSHLGLTSDIHCDFRFNDAALNWAITRAKLGLFIVAEESKEEIEDSDCGSWRELVKYYDTNKLTTDHSILNQ